MHSHAMYRSAEQIGKFELHIMEEEFVDPRIVVMLGENETGKMTFLCLLVSHNFIKANCLNVIMVSLELELTLNTQIRCMCNSQLH
ncbi:ABC transporter E family member 1-like [Papaver somniferum]|uniref:ABC transporter E family member 1-like n=1 Tax=Papaver somniferum TaxID=3469 RepID=UPI000E6F5D37|nr:ABC transporter E family member 1-like [Papaver somniferum]